MKERAGPASSPAAPVAMDLLRTLHEVEGRLEAALEPMALSLAKFNVLWRLAEAGGDLPLSTLAERCACVRSNITQLVDRLEADRLVARVDDPRDRRSIRAELTGEGRTRLAEGQRALEQAEERLLDRLSGRQRESLKSLLEGLRGEP